MLTTYPSQKQLESELDNIEGAINKYPILVNYFKQKKDISKLQNLSLINPFSNMMINKHSYKISREDAKSRKIDEELHEMKYEKEYKSYKNFEKGWNNIYELATKYQCRPEMVPKKISQNDFITYCLNDDGEFEYGMYLASMYDLFITYQNTFLKSVIDNLKGNFSNYSFKFQAKLYNFSLLLSSLIN